MKTRKVNVRLTDSVVELIDNVVGGEYGENEYGDRAHFLRCALFKLLREETGLKNIE